MLTFVAILVILWAFYIILLLEQIRALLAKLVEKDRPFGPRVAPPPRSMHEAPDEATLHDVER